MSIYVDVGIRGAKRQSWKQSNPRELLKRVIDDNAGSDREAVLNIFRNELRREDDAEDYVDTIIEYWFANNYHSLVGPAPAIHREAGVQTSRIAQEIEARVRAKILERAAIVLSDMVMPNGKRLADCTGKECAQMGAAIGGLMGRVSQLVKPKQTVGQALSEAQLQELYVGKALT